MATTPKIFAVNPKEWRVFKLWVSLTPLPSDLPNEYPKRLTVYREMGRLALSAYNQLGSNALIKLPEPPASATTSGSLISGIVGSFNYTPQIGNTEPYIFVMGHYHSTRDIEDVYSTKPVFSGGVLYNIPSSSPANNPTTVAPNPNVIADVIALKNIIDSEMATILPSDVEYNIDKIDYLGVVFGAGGLHFPV